MRLLPTICALLLAAGCGDDTMMPPDNPQPASCGTEGAASGSECTGLDECGGGASNYKEVAFCEHCFAGPDTHVCEAGTCRALDAGGTLRIAIGVAEAARGAGSFTVAVVLPTMADGTKVTCQGLLSSECQTVNNRLINTSNSTFQNFVMPAGGADPAFTYMYGTSADLGSDRLVFMQAVSETQGKGTLMARGCVEGINVVPGTTEVVVELSGL